jgi:hypothetical protein
VFASRVQISTLGDPSKFYGVKGLGSVEVFPVPYLNKDQELTFGRYNVNFTCGKNNVLVNNTKPL